MRTNENVPLNRLSLKRQYSVHSGTSSKKCFSFLGSVGVHVYQNTLFKTMFLTTFYGFLRIGALASKSTGPGRSVLRHKDLSFLIHKGVIIVAKLTLTTLKHNCSKRSFLNLYSKKNRFRQLSRPGFKFITVVPGQGYYLLCRMGPMLALSYCLRISFNASLFADLNRTMINLIVFALRWRCELCSGPRFH